MSWWTRWERHSAHREHSSPGRAIFVGGTQTGEASGPRLKELAQLVELTDVLLCEWSHEHPVAWNRIDESVMFQAEQRLAHRGTADTKLLRELDLVQTLVGSELPQVDHLDEPRVHGLDQATGILGRRH